MIRQSLVEWKRATDMLLATLTMKEEEKRDEVIEQVEKLLDVREALQKEIEGPFTKEEEAFAKELLVTEQQFQQKISEYFKNIRNDISIAQSKKTNMKNYMDPYRNLAQDGAYYDTKQ